MRKCACAHIADVDLRGLRKCACAHILRRTDQNGFYFVCLFVCVVSPESEGCPCVQINYGGTRLSAQGRGEARTDILGHESRAKASVGSHCKPTYQHGVPLHPRSPRGDIRRNRLLSLGDKDLLVPRTASPPLGKAQR
jgi:hypothetical protein